MNVALITAPYDSGHHGRRFGAGPGAILDAGLAGRLERCGHRVAVEDIGEVGDPFAAEIATGFAVCRAVAARVRTAAARGAFPIVIAGNCLTTVGAVAGEAADAVMWFDQHGDFNTPETSAYGFLDGMALACVVGRCWRPMTASVDGFRPVPEDRTVLVDARDLDPDELVLLGRSAITRVATDGAAGAAQTLRDRGTRSCHLHLDLDVHDPADLRVNQYAAPGGPTRAALREAVCRVAVLLPLAGMTVSAYDPALDRDAAVPEAVADLLVECLATMDGCHA